MQVLDKKAQDGADRGSEPPRALVTSLAQTVRAQIAKLPEVTAVVVSDPSGAMLEASGAIDGETAAAVYAVAVEALGRAGEQLGLGPFLRASITGPAKACLVCVHDEGIVSVQVDPTKPMAGV